MTLSSGTKLGPYKIYTHAQDEAKRKALEKFEARLVQ